MSKVLFNQIADLPALEKQKQDILKIFGDIKTAVVDLGKQGVKIDAADGMAKMAAAYRDIEALQKKFEESQKKLLEIENQLQKAREESSRKTKTQTDDEVRASILSQQQRRQRIADIKAENNEYLQLSNSLKKAQDEAKRLQAIAYKSGSSSDINSANQAVAKAKELYDQVYKIDTKTGDFRRRVGDYNSVWEGFAKTGKNAIDKIDGGFTSLWNNLKVAAASFIGITGIFEFGKSSIESFEKVQMQTERLENALKNMGGTAKDVKLLSDSVDQLSTKYTYLGKTDLRESQQRLVQFGKLSAQQITDLMPVIINFAANARITVQEATDTIVKGVEGNARALKLYGINVKDAGSEAERFKLITDELSKKTAGSADIFQNSAAGAAETYRKRLAQLQVTIGQELMPAYEGFLKTSIKIVQAIKEFGVGNLIRDIGILVGVWALYRTTLLLSSAATAINTASLIASTAATESITIAKAAQTVAEAENATVTKASTVLSYLFIGAQKLYAAVTRAATFEMTIFNTTMKVSPLGVFIAVLGIAVTLFTTLSASAAKASDSLKSYREQQQLVNDVEKDAAKQQVAQRDEIEKLVAKIRDHKTSLDEKGKALKELKSHDEDYLGRLNLTNISTAEGKKLIDDYIAALDRKAFAEAAEGKKKTLADKLIDLKVEEKNRDNQYSTELVDAKDKNAHRTDIGIKAGANFGGDKFENAAIRQQTESIDYVKKAGESYLKDTKENLKKQVEVNKQIETLNLIIKENDSKVKFSSTPGLTTELKGSENKGDSKGLADENKLSDEIRKKKFEALKIQLQDQAEANKVTVDNDKEAFDKRLQAAKDYYDSKKVIIEGDKSFALSDIDQREQEALKQAAADKKGADYIRKIHDNADAERLIAVAKYNSDILKLNIESEAQITKVVKDGNEQRKKDLEEAVKKQTDILINAYNDRIQRLEGTKDKSLSVEIENLRKGTITKEIYEQRKSDIENHFNELSLQANIQHYKDILNLDNQTDEKKKDALKNLDDLQKQVLKNSLKLQEDIANKEVDLIEKRKAKYKELAQAAADVFKSAIDAGYENKKNDIQDQIDNVDKLKEAEINRINQTTASEQEKADKIKLIESKSQADKEALQRRQREIDHQKAVFERDFNIFKITAGTIQEIAAERANLAEIKQMQAKGIAAALAGNPLPLIAANAAYALASSQIPLTLAIGAAQIGALIATPLPKYAMGTDNAPGGPSIVGEAGRELSIEPSGKIKLFSEPTLTNLVAGTKILPNRVTEDIIRAGGVHSYQERKNNLELQELTEINMSAVRELKEINRKSRIVIINQAPIDSTAYYQQQMKR